MGQSINKNIVFIKTNYVSLFPFSKVSKSNSLKSNASENERPKASKANVLKQTFVYVLMSVILLTTNLSASQSDTELINNVISGIQESINTQNAEKYLSYFSDEFSYAGGDTIEFLRVGVKDAFKDTLHIEISNISVNIGNNKVTAVVTNSFEIKTESCYNDESFETVKKGREEYYLKKENDLWKIIGYRNEINKE